MSSPFQKLLPVALFMPHCAWLICFYSQFWHHAGKTLGSHWLLHFGILSRCLLNRQESTRNPGGWNFSNPRTLKLGGRNDMQNTSCVYKLYSFILLHCMPLISVRLVFHKCHLSGSFVAPRDPFCTLLRMHTVHSCVFVSLNVHLRGG